MTRTLTTDELRQIAETDHVQCGDAAEMARELLANREAQPVACDIERIKRHALPAGECPRQSQVVLLSSLQRLLTAPPVPAVPECFLTLLKHAGGMAMGTDWNSGTAAKYHRTKLCEAVGACRAAMLAQPVSGGYKLKSPEIPDGCQWTFDEHDSKWDSGCGEAWMFCDGDPTENGVRFCQSCGKPVLLAAAPEGGNDHDTRR
ncbi:hypothetical protein [Serratia ureilytica]|uniref:hypothetical protein n=1 Tax=Serratia ureilytica TaxID=300181 RepID=UPI003F81EDD1